MRPRAELHAGLLLFAAVMVSCGDPPIPKPRGYFRIDLPAQAYTNWEPPCPFSAELPVYAATVPSGQGDRPCWWNLTFPGQRAIVHLTYLPVENNLQTLIEEAHGFKERHESRALRIRNERILNDSARVFGTLFDVEGDVAAPMVFYLTDSTHHFLYGSLYFSARPNADSLAPVTERLRADLRHMAATLRWR
jgi:gliding motility-associated lipoprotein GldD